MLLIGKKNVVLLMESDRKEKWGMFIDSQIVGTFNQRIPVGSESFAFCFGSSKQISEPVKYDVKDRKKAGYLLHNEITNSYIAWFGPIALRQEDDLAPVAYCYSSSLAFNCQNSEPFFKTNQCYLKQILVFQLN